MTRRGFLGLAGAGGAMVALGSCGLGGIDLLSGQTGELVRSTARLPRPFTVPLPIPPVKRPVRSDADTDYYEVVQREADLEILPGLRTRALTYDGTVPGPTFVGRGGRRAVVRHRNELAVPTVVHLHGGHTPAEHDGYPTDLLLPAGGWRHGDHTAGGMAGEVSVGERDYVYPSRQRAATLWYHDHRMDFTGPQVYRGLAGFHLLHDDESDALPLPRGERDVPLMICDRAFAEDGSLRYPSLDRSLRSVPGVEPSHAEGVLGDVVLVNGAPWPVHEVDAARYRLRILNASNARRYGLVLDPAPAGAASFTQVGSDGGLLDRPRAQHRIDIAPGERFDVVVDFAAYRPGTVVTVRNALGEGGAADVLRFVVGARVADDSRVPERLSRVERLDPARAVRTRMWRFTRGRVGGHAGWTINGSPFDPARRDAEVRLGEVEIWRFVADVHHPVHVHLDPFQVLRRGGGGPGAYDHGWKDTVDVRPGEVVDVAVRFSSYLGTFMLHCHNLEHEDMAMMAAFGTR